MDSQNCWDCCCDNGLAGSGSLVEQALNLDICGGSSKNRTYDLSIIREVRRIRRIPMRAEPSHSVQVR
jgi:hypothetical protein